MSSIPILPFAVWASGTNQNSIPANDNSRRNQILNGNVISQAVTAQPASPAEGDIYIIASTHTGAQWAGFTPKDLTIFSGGTWYAYAPVEGVVVNVAGSLYKYASGSWAAAGGSSSAAGSDKQVQFNDGGAFGAEAGFEYDKSTNTMTVEKVTFTGLALTAASATGGAGIRLPHGAAPTSPTNGDVWTTTGGIYVRINGATVGPLAAGGTFTGGALSSALDEAKGSDIASASTTNIAGATGNFVHVTGTTTITAFGTAQAGTRRIVVFDGALTLTHNGTSLILPTGANITTAAGDTATAVSEGSGNWRVTSYQKKDGTALAGTGGSLTNFTEAVNTSSPNATVPVVSLTATNAATNVDAVLAPKGTGSLASQVADSTSTGGNKRGTFSVDFQRGRSSASQVASGGNSVIVGGNSNTASQSYAFVGSGLTCTASATNTAIVGGELNTASASHAFVGGGYSNTSSGSRAVVCGGHNNTAAGDYSFIGGGIGGTTRGLQGASAHASGQFAAVGDAQSMAFVYKRATANATPVSLSSDGSAPAAATSIVLPNSSCYGFEAVVTARDNATGNAAVFKIVGAIKRGANAAATAILGTPTVTTVGADAGASTWAAAAAANTTLGSLEIQVTGAAATNIRWVASVKTTEVAG